MQVMIYQAFTLKITKSLPLLLLAFSGLTGPSALAQLNCGPVFLGQITSSPAGIFQSHHLEQVYSGKGRFGQEFITVQRRAVEKKRFLRKNTSELAEWHDFQINPDKPGDIRWGAQYLPSALKEMLGINALNRQGQNVDAGSPEVFYVQVPTPATGHRVLTHLESKMKQKNSDYKLINFYETGGDILSGLQYLENFAARAELPISKSGHLFEHDLNYHFYSSLVTPSFFTKALQNRAQVFLEFHRFVKEKSAHSRQYAELYKVLNENHLPELVERIDLSTGNLFGSTVRMKSENLHKIMNEVQESLDHAFLGETNPYDFLGKFLKRYPANGLAEMAHREFAPEVADRHFETDVTKEQLNNPGELYNEAQSQLKEFNRIAAELP